MRLTSTCVLVLSVLVFAGAAYAGNGNGKGNEGDAPGNSANAPGQVKKDVPPPAAETTTTAAVSTTAPATATTTSSAANATGVKPSNDTAHETHAQAQSDQTKEYGNGQTAGQIAEKNGAAGSAVLHGPGNSQPHKLAPCAGGHEVDVHALKSHRSGSCGGPAPAPRPGPSPTPNPGPTPGPPSHTTTTTTATTTTTTTSVTDKPSDPGSKPASGDAPRAVATVHVHPGHSRGVLAATQRIGQAATLPFTGQRLWFVALLGVLLIVTGLALREIRTAEASVESGHDHTDRSRNAARSTRAPVGGGPGR